jgi:hypothetical protein
LPYPKKCRAPLPPFSLSLDSDPRRHDSCARHHCSRPVRPPPAAHPLHRDSNAPASARVHRTPARRLGRRSAVWSPRVCPTARHPAILPSSPPLYHQALVRRARPRHRPAVRPPRVCPIALQSVVLRTSPLPGCPPDLTAPAVRPPCVCPTARSPNAGHTTWDTAPPPDT